MEDSLIQKLYDRDEKAQRELIDRFNSRIFLYFKLRIKGENNYEDLVQEVFSCFFSGVEKKKIGNDFMIAPFIFGIARRIMFNYFYRKKRETHIKKSAEERFEFAYDFKEERRLENQKLGEVVKEVIDRLPPIDKRILREFYLNENKIEEVAHILGKTRHYISVRKERALKRIKSEICQRQDLY